MLLIFGATIDMGGIEQLIESMYRFSMLFYDDSINDVGSLSIDTHRFYKSIKLELNL